MAFGQGLTVTPIQLAAAYASLLNGGTYYKPSLVKIQTIMAMLRTFKPKIVKQAVVSASASNQIRELLQKSLEINNKAAVRAGYSWAQKAVQLK